MRHDSIFLENILIFINSMRRAGLSVSIEQSMDVVQALQWIDISNQEQFYYTLRVLLVSRHEHLPLFDILYHRFWRKIKPGEAYRRQVAPQAPRHNRKHHRPLLINYMANKAKQDDPEIEVADKSGTFSAVEVLQRKDFSQLTDEELYNIRRLIEEMRWKVSLRETRRYIADNNGKRLHMRHVMRSATRYGGVPVQLAWQKRKIKARPLVLIADISGSMEKYSRLVLQFFYSISRSIKNVECFVFGTRLTRITMALKIKNMDLALDEAGREVVDWAGGTRIGESLHTFNKKWSRRVLRRGAVVIIVSDGWEHGNSDLLKKEMHYLQLRCHRLIWLNPLSGKKNYQPLVSGMASAMKYVDDFLPVHNLQSLSELALHLQSLD